MGKLERSKYYHNRVIRGIKEEKDSYVRKLCEENLMKKLARKEKERELDPRSKSPSDKSKGHNDQEECKQLEDFNNLTSSSL